VEGGVTKKRRTETTIETRQRWIVTRADKSPLIYCPDCPDGSSLMVAPEEAAVLVGVNLRFIYRWVEAERIHYSETSAGAVLVCLESLAVRARSGKFICEGERQ
jgi:hypothetical protein